MSVLHVARPAIGGSSSSSHSSSKSGVEDEDEEEDEKADGRSRPNAFVLNRIIEDRIMGSEK